MIKCESLIICTTDNERYVYDDAEMCIGGNVISVEFPTNGNAEPYIVTNKAIFNFNNITKIEYYEAGETK